MPKMPDLYVVPASAVERLKRKAKKLHKETGVPHHAALDAVAREGGTFPNWHHLIEAAKATEPAEQAFKRGLVVGIDIKDALDVAESTLKAFVPDERLTSFIFEEFGLDSSAGLGAGDDWRIDILQETVFFRSRRIVPASLDEALNLSREDFFFPPMYVRLKGRLLVNPLEDSDGEEGGRHE